MAGQNAFLVHLCHMSVYVLPNNFCFSSRSSGTSSGCILFVCCCCFVVVTVVVLTLILFGSVCVCVWCMVACVCLP